MLPGLLKPDPGQKGPWTNYSVFTARVEEISVISRVVRLLKVNLVLDFKKRSPTGEARVRGGAPPWPEPKVMASAVALALLLALSAAVVASDSDDPATIRRICGSAKIPDPQDYDSNFVSVMETVAQAMARDGSGSAAFGDPPDRIYAFGQCFGGLDQVTCRLCYAQGRVNLPLCLPAMAGRIFLEGCFLRYDARNFSGVPNDAADASLCGGANASDPARLAAVVERVAGGLRIGPGKSSARAEAEEFGVRVFGAAECWRELGPGECEECLARARERVKGCVPATDGRALNAGCYMRYSTSRIYYGTGSGGASNGL